MPSTFSSTVAHGEDRTLIHARGEIDIATADELRAVIASELGPNAVLLIDLSETDFLDSSGIAVLIGAKSIQERQGGSLAVLHPSNVAKMALIASGVETLIADD